MPNCRVGITTDPDRRKMEWEEKYPNLRNWKILSKHNSRSSAQSAEESKARGHGCKSHPRGGGPEMSTWYVYHFEY